MRNPHGFTTTIPRKHMSLLTNPAILFLRNVGRKIGINSSIAKLILGSEYEHSYDQALSEQLHPGDCIWDVGANIGHYTGVFANAVGPDGRVIAFEPSPVNFLKLESEHGSHANVELYQMAMGDVDSHVCFGQGKDALGATSKVVSDSDLKVEMRTGRSLLENGKLRFPNIIKIDVEGYELEVLRGFGNLLNNTKLHAIGIEVHFQLLSQRGNPSAPKQIETMLQEFGFEMRWVDPSHLIGTRLPKK